MCLVGLNFTVPLYGTAGQGGNSAAWNTGRDVTDEQPTAPTTKVTMALKFPPWRRESLSVFYIFTNQ